MNPEVLQDLYDRAVSKGYGKSKDEFSALLQTNQSVFDDNYSYVKSKGYNKSVDEFGALVGKKKSTTAEAASLTRTGGVSGTGLEPSPVPKSKNVEIFNTKDFSRQPSKQKAFTTSFGKPSVSGPISGEKLKQDDVNYIVQQAVESAKGKYGASFEKNFYDPNGGVNKQFTKSYLDDYLGFVGYTGTKTNLNEADKKAIEVRFDGFLETQKAPSPAKLDQFSRNLAKAAVNMQKNAAIQQARTPEEKKKVEQIYTAYTPKEPKSIMFKEEKEMPAKDMYASTKGVLSKDVMDIMDDEMIQDVNSYLIKNKGEYQKYIEYGTGGSLESQLELISKAMQPKFNEAVGQLQYYIDNGSMQTLDQMAKLSTNLSVFDAQMQILKKQIDAYQPSELTPEEKKQFDIDKGNFQVKETEYKDLSNKYNILKDKLSPVFDQLSQLKPYAEAGDENSIVKFKKLVEDYRLDIEQYNALIPELQRIQDERNVAMQVVNKYAASAKDINAYNQYKQSIDKYNALVNQASPLLNQYKELSARLPQEDVDKIFSLISTTDKIINFGKKSDKLLNSKINLLDYMPLGNPGQDYLIRNAITPAIEAFSEFTLKGVSGVMRGTSDFLEMVTGKPEDYYSGADFYADFISKGYDLSGDVWTNDILPGYRRKDFIDPLTGDYKWTPQSVVVGTFEQFGQLAGAALGTQALMGASMGFNSAVVAPMFFATYDDNKELAKQLGYQGSSATSAGVLFSLIEGTSELIFPDIKLFQGSLKKELFKTFMDNYSKGGKRVAIRSILETVGKENGEEVAVEIGKYLTTLMTRMAGNENQQYNISGSDLLQTFVFTTLAAGAPAAVQSVSMSSKNFNGAAKYEMAKDLEASFQMIDTYNNLGKIDDAKANKLKTELKAISAVQGQMPSDIIEPKRIAISNIYAERAELQRQLDDSRISPEIKVGIKKMMSNTDNAIAAIMMADDTQFSNEWNKSVREETATVMEAFNNEVAPPVTEEQMSKQDQTRMQILNDIFGDTKVQRDADALEQRMNNAEEISVEEVNAVLDGLYAQVESIMDNYFDNEAGKQYAQALLDKIDKLQNYEFTTGTKTDVITERKAVQIARNTVAKEANVINLARAPRATATITTEDGATGTYSIEVSGDGAITFEQRGAEPIQVGNTSDVNKTAKIVETQMNQDGLPTSVTFTIVDKDGKTNTIKVDAKGRMKPARLLDLAIAIRANEVGTVDPTAFDEAFKEVTTETTTKTYPNAVQVETAGQVPVQPKARVGEQVEEGKPQAEPQAPAKEGQEVNQAMEVNAANLERTYDVLNSIYEAQQISQAVQNVTNLFMKSGLRVEVIEDENEYIRIAGAESLGLFNSEDGVIYYNPSRFDKNWGKTIVYHEGVHPIINIIRNTNPDLYNSVRDGLVKLSNRNAGVKAAFDFAEKNSVNRNPESIEDEQIVETISQIASGRININEVPQTLMDKIIEFLNTISNSLGLGRPFKQNDIKSAASIARQITKALQTGKGLEGIVGKKNIGKYQWDYEVQKRVSDVFDGILDKIGIKYGKETKKGVKKSTNYDVAKALSEYYKSQFKKIRVGDFSNKSIDLVSDYASDEIIFAMERFGKESGLGWYTEDFAKALDILSQLDESILSDPNVKEIATVAIAIASNSTDVLTNLTRIIYAIDYYNKNKSIPDNIGVGKGASAIASSIKRYNNLLENHFNGDVVALKEFMQTVRTVSESKQALIEKTGMKSWAQVLKSDLGTDPEWNENETLPTSVIIFGPKIGAFYSNLSGIGGTPTIDRWCIRTMYRYFGDMRSKVLPSEMNQFIEQQNLQGQSKGSVISLMEAHYKIFNDILQGKGEYANLSKDERNKLLSPYRKGHSIYSKLENIVNEIEDGLTEKITNKSQYAKDFRSFTKKSFEMVQQKVENKTGLKLQISDIQAILWIFEKNLFGYMGVKQKADSTYSAGANTIIDRVNSGKYTIDNLKKGNVKIDKNTILEDSSMGDVVAVNQKDYVLGVSDQPARLNSKVKTQPSPAAARGVQYSPATPRGTIPVDEETRTIVEKTKGITPKSMSDVAQALSDGSRVFGYYEMDEEIEEIPSLLTAGWFDLGDIKILPYDKFDTTLKSDKRIPKQYSPMAARGLMNADQVAVTEYPIHVQLVNDAMVAYDLGVRNYIHFADYMNEPETTTVRMAWDDAVRIKRGKEPFISITNPKEGLAQYKNWLRSLNKIEDRNIERNKELRRNWYRAFMEKSFDSKFEFFNALAQQSGEPWNIVAAYTHVIGGQAAKADYLGNVFISAVFDGLSDKEEYMVNNQKYSARQLLNRVMIRTRVIEVQRKMEDKFNSFTFWDNQIKNSEKRISDINDEIEDLKKYLILEYKRLNPSAKIGDIKVIVPAILAGKRTYAAFNNELIQYQKLKNEIATLEQDIEYSKPFKADFKEYLDRNDVLSYDKATKTYSLKNYNFTGGLTAGSAQQDIDTLVRLYPQLASDLIRRTEAYSAAWKELLQKQLDNGLISKEAFDDMVKYKYVPMKNIGYMLSEVVYGDELRIGKNNEEMIKRLSGGSEEDISMEFDELLKFGTYMTYRKIAQNNAAKELYNAVINNPENTAFYIPYVESTDKYGNETAWKIDDKNEGIIAVYIDGVKKGIATNQFVAKGWKGANKVFPNVDEALGLVFMTTPFRAITTNLNPGFAMAQLLLDMPQAILASEAYSSATWGAGAVLFNDFRLMGGKALNKVAKKLGLPANMSSEWDKVYEEAVQYGALVSFSKGGKTMDFGDKSWFTKRIETIGNGFAQYRDKVEAFNSAIEYSTRLVIYRKMRDKLEARYMKANNGAKPTGKALDDIRTQAAAASLNVLNYNRGGTIVKPLNNAMAYLNVGFQVFYSNAQYIKKNPYQFTFKAMELTAWGVLNAVLGYMMADDDDKRKYRQYYSELSSFEKRHYWHVVNPNRDSNDKNTFFARFKKPTILLGLINTTEAYALNEIGATDVSLSDYIKKELPKDMLNMQPFSTSVVTSVPTLNAMFLYYGNYDLYRNQKVVFKEETTRDWQEGIDDATVGRFYKYVAQLGMENRIEEEGLISPMRMDRAVKGLIGNYETNPTTAWPLSGLNQLMIAMSGDYEKVYQAGPDEPEKTFGSILIEGIGFNKRFLTRIPKSPEQLVDIKNETLKKKNALDYELKLTVDQIINENPTREERVKLLKDHWQSRKKYFETTYSIEDYARSLSNALAYLDNYDWITNTKIDWLGQFIFAQNSDLKKEIYTFYTKNMTLEEKKSVLRAMVQRQIKTGKTIIPSDLIKFMTMDIENSQK